MSLFLIDFQNLVAVYWIFESYSIFLAKPTNFLQRYLNWLPTVSCELATSHKLKRVMSLETRLIGFWKLLLVERFHTLFNINASIWCLTRFCSYKYFHYYLSFPIFHSIRFLSIFNLILINKFSLNAVQHAYIILFCLLGQTFSIN